MNAQTIALACQRGFTRAAWESLTADERRAVIADVDGLATELATDDADELDYPSAVVELRRRIGGFVNLASYAKCLTVRAVRTGEGAR